MPSHRWAARSDARSTATPLSAEDSDSIDALRGSGGRGLAVNGGRMWADLSAMQLKPLRWPGPAEHLVRSRWWVASGDGWDVYGSSDCAVLDTLVDAVTLADAAGSSEPVCVPLLRVGDRGKARRAVATRTAASTARGLTLPAAARADDEEPMAWSVQEQSVQGSWFERPRAIVQGVPPGLEHDANVARARTLRSAVPQAPTAAEDASLQGRDLIAWSSTEYIVWEGGRCRAKVQRRGSGAETITASWRSANINIRKDAYVEKSGSITLGPGEFETTVVIVLEQDEVSRVLAGDRVGLTSHTALLPSTGTSRPSSPSSYTAQARARTWESCAARPCTRSTTMYFRTASTCPSRAKPR